MLNIILTVDFYKKVSGKLPRANIYLTADLKKSIDKARILILNQNKSCIILFSSKENNKNECLLSLKNCPEIMWKLVDIENVNWITTHT